MSEISEFRPELMPRKGEWNAWVFVFLLGIFFLIGSSIWPEMPGAVWLFEGLMILLAASISLGNWVDRRTMLRLSADGIAFENGLRSVRLSWPEVQHVAVVQTPSGKRIQVQGETSHFTFKTATVMSMFAQSVRSGFASGQEILDTVLQKSSMKLTKEAEGVYYYARA
jgi:hypothetical protein